MKNNTWRLLALTVALFIGGTAAADMVVFELDTEFSGAYPPEGTGPWLRATFDDGGSDLTLTLESLLTGDGEHVKIWDFNLDPLLDPTLLDFTYAGSSTGPAASISTGVNAFKADGDGLYDIQFDWGDPSEFTAGEVVEYTIDSPETLTASSFSFLSAPAGGHGPFLTAAHVGGVGDEDQYSGWITGEQVIVPVPGAALLGMVGIGLVGAFRKRFV
ncbi:MAG: hypothetical protein JSU63_21105 [Phycisphaerales bacterium]|nr:MAG: hypothetical protein JSU63_21105 [Phycisphaerales bacterium]